MTYLTFVRNTALKMYDLFLSFCKGDMETRIADLIRNLVTNVFTDDCLHSLHYTNCILAINVLIFY